MTLVSVWPSLLPNMMTLLMFYVNIDNEHCFFVSSENRNTP